MVHKILLVDDDQLIAEDFKRTLAIDHANGKNEQWVYGSSGQYYYLTNGKLRSWQNSQ